MFRYEYTNISRWKRFAMPSKDCETAATGKAVSPFVRAILDFTAICHRNELIERAVETIRRMEGLEMCAAFRWIGDSRSYILTVNRGFPSCFPGSGGRMEKGSRLYGTLSRRTRCLSFAIQDPPLEDENGEPVHVKAVIPVGEKTFRIILLAAAREKRELPVKTREQLLLLEGSLRAGLKRIGLEKKTHEEGLDKAALLESIRSPVFAVGKKQKLIFCSRFFGQLVRTETDDALGSSIETVAGAEFADLVNPGIKDVMESEKPSLTIVKYRERTFSTSMHPYSRGVLVVMEDVTDNENARNKLRFRDKVENLIISITTDFIKMQGSALNLGIHDALLNIGVILEVDRAYLFQFNDDLGRMTNTHEWCASNIQPQIDSLQDLKTSEYPWWMNRLREFQIIHIPRVSDMPEAAQAEKELLEMQDIQSLVVVPIVHGRDLIGFAGFDSVNRERSWSDDTIDLLRIVGDAIGNALVRNRMERELVDMYRRAEKEAQINAVLLREVNHRVKNNLSEIIGLLYAQKRFSEVSERGEKFIGNLIGRIRGLATVHDLLSHSRWRPLMLTGLAKEIVSGAVANFSCRNRITTSVSRSTVEVDSNQAHALALILNELVRNSLKHALMEDQKLAIKVRMRKQRKSSVRVIYSDNGPGYPREVIDGNKGNLGLDLVRNLITKNLQGKLELFNNDEGAAARIVFSTAADDEEDE